MVALRSFVAAVCLVGFAVTATVSDSHAEAAADPRIEARSVDLLAVGIVRGNRMSIHLSRPVDNSPVRDAALNVFLRGGVHPTVAEADGSYTLESDDLLVSGPAAVRFQVTRGSVREDLQGSLMIGNALPERGDGNSARQLWWWVLNFAVCIGFLMLISRRRKAAARE